MTRFAWSAAALLLLPVGCTLLANNALPEDDAAGGDGAGASGGIGGSPGGTTTGSSGGGGSGGEGCVPSGDEICTNGADDDCDGDFDCVDADCDGFSCQEAATSGTFVLAGLESCPGDYVERTLSACSECSCNVDDVGTCSFAISFHDDPACANPPLETHTVASDCDTVNVSGGATTYGMATTVGADPPSCTPSGPSEPTTPVMVCEPAGAGSCGPNGVCVPPFDEQAQRCLLFDGDVDCSPAYPSKTPLFEDGSTSCTCSCAPGEQTCPTGKHTHTYDNATCTSPYVSLDDGAACKDTTHMTVLSVDNHDEPLQADSASCINDSAPAAAITRTLCCK